MVMLILSQEYAGLKADVRGEHRAAHWTERLRLVVRGRGAVLDERRRSGAGSELLVVDAATGRRWASVHRCHAVAVGLQLVDRARVAGADADAVHSRDASVRRHRAGRYGRDHWLLHAAV